MNNWIILEKGCETPKHGEKVLITIWMDNSRGKGTDIEYVVDVGEYNRICGYLDAELHDLLYTNAGFDTDNDWDEGQPIKVIAWMPIPKPYIPEENVVENTLMEENNNEQS